MITNEQGRETIWLVDDDPSIRKTLSRSLTKRGYNVETFESAELFLEHVYIGAPSCLLLDLSMPGINGMQLQEKLNERNVGMPIIFITGHGGVPESVQAMKNGAFEFLEKPFLQGTLIRIIDDALIVARQRCENATQVQALLARISTLSPRELEVMHLLVSVPTGLSTKTIAMKLSLSPRTIELHRAKVMKKTGARSIAGLIQIMSALTNEYNSSF